MEKRLELLLNSGQINQDIFNFLTKKLVPNLKIDKWEENEIIRFVTHVAIALMRLAKKETINQVDHNIMKEINCNPNYEKAKIYLKKLFKECEWKISKKEEWYLMIHILNFYNKGVTWK